MELKNKTILITGGGTGIGLAFTKALVDKGNKVIICGRREEFLKEANKKIPGIYYKVIDLENPAQGKLLYNWVTENFPEVSILINNAGIQKMHNFAEPETLKDLSSEISINLTSPIQLSGLFIQHFKKQKESAIINVSSGLAFAPLAAVPIYCATKAALHSFTMSLRYQLRNTTITVIEIAPPIVDTDLDKGARDKRGQTDKGIQPEVIATELIKGIENNETEIVIGMARNLKEAGEKAFSNMNR